jgi:hypothetical protein
MMAATQIFHCCPPVDKLLSGGLARGHILELSGPPGVPKGIIASKLIQDYIKCDEEVLLIGDCHFSSAIHLLMFPDPQNMITPAMLDRTFRRKSFFFLPDTSVELPLRVTGIPFALQATRTRLRYFYPSRAHGFYSQIIFLCWC